MFSKPISYCHNFSPPTRAATVGVDLELKKVNLNEKENLMPEFLKVIIKISQ